MKTELIDGQVYAMHTKVKSAIFWYIEVLSNQTRLHGALSDNSPGDFENSLR